MISKDSDRNSSYWKNKSDGEVWAAFLNDNKHAFAFIYDSFADELFSYGMHIKPNRSFIKDCIHDLFVDLWRQRFNLSQTDNIKFYLYRSLRRKIRYIIERDRKLFKDDILDLPANINVSQPFEQTLIDSQVAQVQKDKIVMALTKLPSRQREVIKLIFFEHLSHEEVSEIMSINIRSVYTLVWKALTSLRKYITGFMLFVLLFNS